MPASAKPRSGHPPLALALGDRDDREARELNRAAAPLRRQARLAGRARSSAATTRSRRRSARARRVADGTIERLENLGRAPAQRARRAPPRARLLLGPPQRRRARRLALSRERPAGHGLRGPRRRLAPPAVRRRGCRRSCRRSSRRSGSARCRAPQQLAALARGGRARRRHAKLLYGTALQRLGRPVSAEREFAAAARLAPDDPDARVAAAVGRFDKANPARAFCRLGPLTRRLPACPDRALPPRPAAALVGAGRRRPASSSNRPGARTRTRCSAGRQRSTSRVWTSWDRLTERWADRPMASVRPPWKTAASAAPRAECHEAQEGSTRVSEQGVRAKPSSIAEVLETDEAQGVAGSRARGRRR